MWLNAISSVKGISQKYPIREISTGNILDFKSFRVVFRSYFEAHDEPNTTNNTAPMNHKCIELGTNGNIQGKKKVFLLKSGKFLKLRKIIPMISTE